MDFGGNGISGQDQKRAFTHRSAHVTHVGHIFNSVIPHAQMSC